jgi:D-alanine-D-alanine ligase
MINLKDKGLHIAVIMGGTSAERAVSLRSGAAVVKALQQGGYKVTIIDGVEQLMQTQTKQFDAVFNILHGEAGENGALAALLDCLKVKYTGCDMSGGVLSWNKDIAKTLVRSKGLSTPQAQLLNNIEELQTPKGVGPWIVKPTKEGSSVGLFLAKNVKELEQCVNKALQLVATILIEDFIDGTECTVAIVNGQVLPVVRIEPEVGLYDYEAKYESKGTQYFCPSGFSEELEQALKTDAQKAFDVLGLKGWARIDFIVDKEGRRWFLEANTTPGMTETSLVPKAAAAIGWSFKHLVQQILSTAFAENARGEHV